VTKVELLSEELGQQTIWEGRQEINILDLSDTSEIFAVGDKIPVGLYDKIRLHVDPNSLEFVPQADFRLPGNVDKIDLNPRGKFEVREDETLWIRLDFDAAKTLAVSNGGILRLVIFADVIDPMAAAVTRRLTRLRGEITEVNGASVVVCHPTITSTDFCPTVTVGAIAGRSTWPLTDMLS
jgi:hypothetical protein